MEYNSFARRSSAMEDFDECYWHIVRCKLPPLQKLHEYIPDDTAYVNGGLNDSKVWSKTMSAKRSAENVFEETRFKRRGILEKKITDLERLVTSGTVVSTLSDTRQYKGRRYGVVTIGRPKQCKFCDQQFGTERALSLHVQISHTVETEMEIAERVQCIECKGRYKNEDILRRHIVKMHNKRAIKEACTICGAQFSSLQGLTRHRREIHEIEPTYRNKRRRKGCTRPKESTEMKASFRCDIAVFVCGNCRYIADREERIKMHIETKHLE